MSALSVADEDTGPTGAHVPPTADYALPYTSYATSMGNPHLRPSHPDAPTAGDLGRQEPDAAGPEWLHHSPEQAKAFGMAVLRRRCEAIATATRCRRNGLWSAACRVRSLWLSDSNTVPSWGEAAAALLDAGRACAHAQQDDVLTDNEIRRQIERGAAYATPAPEPSHRPGLVAKPDGDYWSSQFLQWAESQTDAVLIAVRHIISLMTTPEGDLVGGRPISQRKLGAKAAVSADTANRALRLSRWAGFLKLYRDSAGSVIVRDSQVVQRANYYRATLPCPQKARKSSASVPIPWNGDLMWTTHAISGAGRKQISRFALLPAPGMVWTLPEVGLTFSQVRPLVAKGAVRRVSRGRYETLVTQLSAAEGVARQAELRRTRAELQAAKAEAELQERNRIMAEMQKAKPADIARAKAQYEDYRRRGWWVIPLQAYRDLTCDFARNGKQPFARLTPNGIKNASKDRAAHEAWAEKVPRCNFGISCRESMIDVVDIDIKVKSVDEETGEVSWLKDPIAREIVVLGDLLDLLRGDLSLDLVPTFTVMTPTGGYHLIYQASPDWRLRQASNVLQSVLAVRGGTHVLASIDTIGQSGYVVGYGSSRLGHGYDLVIDCPLAFLTENDIRRLRATERSA